MRAYADDQERVIRLKRRTDDWMRSGLIDAAQHERLAADLRQDLRRTNRFLRLTLFGFGLLIIGAAVGLVDVTLDVTSETRAGVLFLVAAAPCVLLAEFLIARFRVYRFGVEEACAIGAAVLVAVGSGLITDVLPGDRQVLVGLTAGSAAAAAVYRRYGYVYAAVAAMLCASLVPFQLDLSSAVQRLLAAAILAACFVGVRVTRLRYCDEFPGDEHGIIQAAAWLGVYAALNLHLFAPFFARSPESSFYWFTYAAIWILPAAGLALSIRNRDRPLLDASLVTALATLLTNKPYLGAAPQTWDPILLGLLLIGTATLVRRWLSRGEDRSRHGFTPTRLLRSDRDALAATALASAAFHPATTYADADSPSPDSFEGGRSGGGGGGTSF